MANEGAAGHRSNGGNIDPADVVGDEEGARLWQIAHNVQLDTSDRAKPGKEAARPRIFQAEGMKQVIERKTGEKQRQHRGNSQNNSDGSGRADPPWLHCDDCVHNPGITGASLVTV